MMNTERYDVLVIGAGVAGLNCALNLPRGKRVLVVCKGGIRESDSFLAQGGICVLRDENDFDGYFEDTMRAGHYENNPDTVRCMIENSRDTISDLVGMGVRFARENGEFVYTREGAHSRPRILFHEDCTGREITSHVLKEARTRENIEIRTHTSMIDLICDEGNTRCFGVVMREGGTGRVYAVTADATVLATGGVGGLFRHSTNFPLLTGDGLAVCLKHGVALEHPDYVQIHPTTLYTGKPGRKFLISESVRGEGAKLLNAKGERFVDELQPRDVVAQAIFAEMKKEGSKCVRLDMRTVDGGADTLRRHFPGIVNKCAEEGFDVFSRPIPVVPAQHYFMGGIKSDLLGRTTMKDLYAVGETCCNGVHGKNRLASNSLLEALIFAKRAASDIAEHGERADEAQTRDALNTLNENDYRKPRALAREYKKAVRREVRHE